MTEQAATTAQTSPAPPRKRSKSKVKWIKRIIAIVVILALVLGIGFGMWYMVFRDDGTVGAPLTDVSRIGNIQSVVQGYGNAMPKETAAITLTAGGTVQAVYVTQGQTVFAGDPLYTIDSQAARDKVTEAEKGVTAAENDVTAAERAVVDAERAVGDREKDITTAEKGVTEAEKGVETAQKGVTTAEKGVATAEKGVTDAEKGVTTAREGVTAAQEKLDQRNKELAEIKARTTDLSVSAPFAGKLTNVKSFTVGQRVVKDETIATLVNDKKLTIPFYFSYAYEDDIYVGQKVSVSIPAVMRDLTGSVEKINKVSFISPEGGIHFEVVVVIDNPGTLTEGMDASASISANGSVLYPYAMGKTAFYETQEIRAKESGPVVSVGNLMNYTNVSSGETLLKLGSDDLDEEIRAKNEEITAAKEAVEAAKERVEQAQEAVEAAKERVEQAQEAVEQAKEAVVRAQENVEAAKEGVETAILNVDRAKEDVLKAQENVVKAQEKVLEAQEEVVKAQEGLDNFDAVAPIDGTIFSCTLSEGQEVKEGETVITISNTTTMLVDIQVDSRNIGFIQAGMMMELTDDWGNPVMGTVTNIAMEGDIGTGTTTYPVQLEVDNFMGTIYNGSWLNYKLVTSESIDCVLIPNQCVKRVNDVNGDIYTVVFIQSDFQPDNAIEMDETMLGTALPTPAEGFWPIPVTTGISDTYNVEIVEGLDAGVEVFTNRETNSASIW